MNGHRSDWYRSVIVLIQERKGPVNRMFKTTPPPLCPQQLAGEDRKEEKGSQQRCGGGGHKGDLENTGVAVIIVGVGAHSQGEGEEKKHCMRTTKNYRGATRGGNTASPPTWQVLQPPC